MRMSSWQQRVVQAVVGLASMASAVVGGVFLAFSDFLMTSMRDAGEPCGSTVMKAINVEVFGSVFLGTFIVLAPLSVVLPVVAKYQCHARAATVVWLGAAAVIYVGGCVLVTGAGNVPLNNALAASDSTYWTATYLSRWTTLNTYRTAACLAASACYLNAFLLLGEGEEIPLRLRPPTTPASALLAFPSSDD
mmetsp:Transcript_19144/g.61620  ORF Transcript_19144/g.61620 Transcript_19144/m.61620 type:complete len:192 (-) Transcript_19144:1249-1824(-)